MAIEETPARTDPALKDKLAEKEMSSVADNSEAINCSDMIVEELVLEDFEVRNETNSTSKAQIQAPGASQVLAETLLEASRLCQENAWPFYRKVKNSSRVPVPHWKTNSLLRSFSIPLKSQMGSKQFNRGCTR